MSENEKIELYEDQPIRTAWNETEEWYFSIVDVVGVLTDQPDARHASTYWAVLKKRMSAEGADQLLTNCKQLKLKASDGKHRLTDMATTEQLLRIKTQKAELSSIYRQLNLKAQEGKIYNTSIQSTVQDKHGAPGFHTR